VCTRLGDDRLDRLSEINVQALTPRNLEFSWVQSELVKHRSVDVGHIVPVLDSMEADFIGSSMRDAALDAAPRQPYRKTKRMMVAAVGALRARRPAELGREHHKRVVEQAALLQILEETGDRLIYLLAKFGMSLLEITVRIPLAGPAVLPMENLHKMNARFRQAPRRQAHLSERTSHLMIQAVETASRF